MGSFHSENVDDLMAQSKADYEAPPLPFSPTKKDPNEDDFLIDRQTWTFLNHGAFGGALRDGYLRAQDWRRHLESQPLRYFDRDLLPHLVHAARRLASFVKAPETSGFTLLPNVTYGLSTVLRGHARVCRETKKCPSVVILWDTSYGSLKKMAHQLCDTVIEIPLTRYLAQQDWAKDATAEECVFSTAFEETIAEYRTKHPESSHLLEQALVVLDHTTSNTAINMPLTRLSNRVKTTLGEETVVLVDGAHGALAQPLDLQALCHHTCSSSRVDIYLGNGHKWLACPRGIGFLYCPRQDLQDTLLEEPAVLSHGIGHGLQSRFLWDGCRDYAAALALPAVVDHWEAANLDSVQSKIRSLRNQAVQVLQEHWHPREEDSSGVTTTSYVPLELHAPMMCLVRLPKALQANDGDRASSTSNDAKRIQDYLFDQCIEVPIKCIEGVLYVRISCHVYNTIDEYEHLARVLQDYKPAPN